MVVSILIKTTLFTSLVCEIKVDRMLRQAEVCLQKKQWRIAGRSCSFLFYLEGIFSRKVADSWSSSAPSIASWAGILHQIIINISYSILSYLIFLILNTSSSLRKDFTWSDLPRQIILQIISYMSYHILSHVSLIKKLYQEWLLQTMFFRFESSTIWISFGST